MCHLSCIDFGCKALTGELIQGKSILEVGSRNVSGSLRSHVTNLRPAQYIGVDIERGPGVDEICRAEDLINTFGAMSFDLLISTEMLEHVEDWKTVISNMKRCLRAGGYLLVTTRSRGFAYHAWPYDFWRYELEDMKLIFADLEILSLESDQSWPGVFLLARKPTDFIERNLSNYELFSIVKNRRIRALTSAEVTLWDMTRNHTERLYWALLRRVLPTRLYALTRRKVLHINM